MRDVEGVLDGIVPGQEISWNVHYVRHIAFGYAVWRPQWCGETRTGTIVDVRTVNNGRFDPGGEGYTATHQLQVLRVRSDPPFPVHWDLIPIHPAYRKECVRSADEHGIIRPA